MAENLDHDLDYDLCIIGGGLCGLTLAYYLKDLEIKILIIEGRSRLGGRIETYLSEDGTPIELGATWLGAKHTDLTELLAALGIKTMPQYMGDRAIYESISTSPPMLVQLPANDQPSLRIAGGSSLLIKKLTRTISAEVGLTEIVQSLDFDSNHVRIQTDKRNIRAAKVVSTLPPYLFHKSISMSHPLPDDLLQIMNTTHTWMSESIKVGLSFTAPFWHEPSTSGTIVSNVGPIPEMYDHTNFDNNKFALKGFLNGNYAGLSVEERKEKVLAQLRKYYDKQVDNYVSYVDRAWRHEPLTHIDYATYVLPHQHNGHRVYQRPYLDRRLWIAGSETAVRFPGYMNGAVSSAKEVYGQLKALI